MISLKNENDSRTTNVSGSPLSTFVVEFSLLIGLFNCKQCGAIISTRIVPLLIHIQVSIKALLAPSMYKELMAHCCMYEST